MTSPILVTGGAGFLGGWLVRELCARGHRVRVLDLPQARWLALHDQPIERIPGDICNRTCVAAAVRGCRGVIHLAGLPQLWVHPRGRFSQVNYHGAVHVLDEAVRAGCERIVHASSATIWPLHGEAVCPWSDVVGAYSRSKLRAEQHALALGRRGAPIIIVSPTAPIGPGDWSRTPPTQLVLDFCLGKRREYIDTQLNLVDVRDVAAGMAAALETGVVGRRYLLGNSITVSLVELFERLAALTGQPVPRRRIPYGIALLAGVLMEWWADVISRRSPATCVAGVQMTRRQAPTASAADLRTLGATPRSLDETLAATVQWFGEAEWLPTRRRNEYV